MKKKLLAIILMLVMAVALIPAFGAATVKAADTVDEFPDATENEVNKTAYNAIYWAVDNGIVKGYTDGTFKPEVVCTREQFAIMLWRFADEPSANPAAINKFSDAGTFSNGAKTAVAWAVEEGIVAGFNDGTFKPKDEITRAQVAVMLWRYAGKPQVNGSSKFSDIGSFGSGVQNAIIWLEGNKIASGYSDGTFRPDGGCQRQHMAIFLYRYAGNVEKREMVIPEIKKIDGSTTPSEEPTPAQPEKPAEPDNGSSGSDSGYVMKRVDITKDNWQDYLEIVTMKLSKGEGKGYHYSYRLKLKDEYARNYKEHSGYDIPEDLLNAAASDPTMLQVMLASGQISLPNTGDIVAVITVSNPYKEELLIPYSPDGLVIYGSPYPKAISITELTYARYLVRDTMDDERSKELAHVMEVIESVNTLHTEDESVFTKSYVVELTDIGGTIYVWEKK